MNRSWGSRITQIIEALMRIAGRDFSETLQPSDQRDELDAIIVGINIMADDLSNEYRLLDQRVAARTQELNDASDALRILTLTDHLTGVGNRKGLEQELEQRLVEYRRGEPAPVVIFLDLDHFKQINDQLGHDAGDVALRAVAEMIQRCIREGDGVFRLGGDEFAILMGGASDVVEAESLSLRLARTLESTPVLDSASAARLGFSCGVAIARHESTGATLLLEADTAMYVAKRSQGNGVRTFEDSMLWARRKELELTDQLRDGLRDGHVVVPYYQPIVDLATRSIVAAEALLRWEHPSYGIIAPDQVLPLARAAGLMGLLTRSIISQVLDQIADWRVDGRVDTTFRVSVNVETEELKNLSFAEFIGRELRARKIPGEMLGLEITENLQLTGAVDEQYAIASLRRMGVRMSIDDFGTGYSAIAYLQGLPADSAKVDRSLIVGIDTDLQKRNLAAAVLKLIQVSGLRSVAEGIETAELAEEAHRVGFDLGQGFYFGRPQTAEAFSEMIDAERIVRM